MLAGEGSGGAGLDAGRVGTSRADVGAVPGASDDGHGAALGQGRRGQRRDGEGAAVGAGGWAHGAVADSGRRDGSGHRRGGRATLLAREGGLPRGEMGRRAGCAVVAARVVPDFDGGGAAIRRDQGGRHSWFGSWTRWLARGAGGSRFDADGQALDMTLGDRDRCSRTGTACGLRCGEGSVIDVSTPSL